jgi:AcrR family transcriptional regulator
MFKTLSNKGEATRDRIRDAALARFRRDGFDATTMRDVAEAADVALGAAYHYFESKDAIVLAYYERVQDEHAARATAALAGARTLRARLGAVMHSKLDILEPDRKLMGALLRYTGTPDHPLSFLGPGTRRLRDDSVAIFAQAVDGEPMPPDVRALAPVALWALHMGILLYYLYDRSPQQARTRALTDRSLDIVVRLFAIAKLPIFRPLRRRVAAMLEEAGLSAAPRQEAA